MTVSCQAFALKNAICKAYYQHTFKTIATIFVFVLSQFEKKLQ